MWPSAIGSLLWEYNGAHRQGMEAYHTCLSNVISFVFPDENYNNIIIISVCLSVCLSLSLSLFVNLEYINHSFYIIKEQSVYINKMVQLTPQNCCWIGSKTQTPWYISFCWLFQFSSNFTSKLVFGRLCSWVHSKIYNDLYGWVSSCFLFMFFDLYVWYSYD